MVADETPPPWEMSDGKITHPPLEKQEEGWWDRVVMSDTPVDATSFDQEKFVLGEMDDLKHAFDALDGLANDRHRGSRRKASSRSPTLDPLQD